MHLRQLSFGHTGQDPKNTNIQIIIIKAKGHRIYKGRYLLGFEVSSPVLERVDENQNQRHYSFPQSTHQCSHMKRQQHDSHQHPPVWHHLVNLETNEKIFKIKPKV